MVCVNSSPASNASCESAANTAAELEEITNDNLTELRRLARIERRRMMFDFGAVIDGLGRRVARMAKRNKVMALVLEQDAARRASVKISATAGIAHNRATEDENESGYSRAFLAVVADGLVCLDKLGSTVFVDKVAQMMRENSFSNGKRVSRARAEVDLRRVSRECIDQIRAMVPDAVAAL